MKSVSLLNEFQDTFYPRQIMHVMLSPACRSNNLRELYWTLGVWLGAGLHYDARSEQGFGK